ncbi:type I secretion system permease/ATPase [Falsirhodobacter deserti]|uniref:type I secretion system permease/ATPase n=1 Tax=Falsirhodobacter deserti TaxID=1365611 RepID=UPI000FE3D037|nr:type I secretion system permease/ATPase [Falsirhodobacter deserti]
MAAMTARSGPPELRQALRQSRGAFAAVAIFSCVCNVLMLTGPLYMMQVYDRVLAARSAETLMALSLLACGLFAMMGLLDAVRGRIMLMLGARVQQALDTRVFRAALRRLSRDPDHLPARAASADLEAVQRLFASPAMLAMFDLPWTPFFAALIFVFHPALGALAVGGGAVLVALTLLNRRMAERPAAGASRLNAEAERMAQAMLADSEVVRALGMRGAVLARWQQARLAGLVRGVEGGAITGAFALLTRTLRLMLQSGMLGLGAWLVLQHEVGAGVMIATSILMGKALTPIETIIGHWGAVMRAREGWTRLGRFLAEEPPPVPRLSLPRPEARLEVRDLTVVPPGASAPVLRGIGFDLIPGEALGVIGDSGAGKTSLIRALVGTWPAQTGHVRLGGAALDQYDGDVLGRHLGYLPQRVTLLDGTVAENIARLDAPDSDQVVAAARRAAAHEMILALPQGYDTRISAIGTQLSGGQIQRIGLARALYGDPVLLLLDEPNASLDAAGTEALHSALRTLKARGGAALVITHRPAAIRDCERLMVLEGGIMRAIGPREAILRQMVRNHSDILHERGAA